MHERSLVVALLRQAESIADAHGAVGIEAIRVELGPLSGVDSTLVRLAFEQETRGTRHDGVNLVLDEIPISGVCRGCGMNWTSAEVRFSCPSCRSQAIQITGGDEFRLLELQVTDDTVEHEAAEGDD